MENGCNEFKQYFTETIYKPLDNLINITSMFVTSIKNNDKLQLYITYKMMAINQFELINRTTDLVSKMIAAKDKYNMQHELIDIKDENKIINDNDDDFENLINKQIIKMLYYAKNIQKKLEQHDLRNAANNLIQLINYLQLFFQDINKIYKYILGGTVKK